MADQNKESNVLEMIKSYARGMLKGNTADTLGAPVDLINELIVRPVATLLGAGDRVSDKPVGGGKYLREKFGQAVEDANPAETVGSMISAGGAAKTAIILPAFLTKSIKDIKTAERALEKGISGDKVYETLGVFKLPENIDDGVMRSVLHPGLAEFNPRALTYDGVNIHSKQELGDVVNFPELFRLVPGLESYRLIPEPGLPVNNAYHRSADQLIGLGNASSKEDLMKSILHEVQHGIQSRYNMNTGASPAMFYEDVNKAGKALKVLHERQIQGDKKAQDAFYRLDRTQDKARDNYKKVAGEAEARAVEAMRSDVNPLKNPITYYGDAYDLNRMIVSPSQVPAVDSDPEIRRIIDEALASQKK